MVNDTTAGYVKSALDYQALESLCDVFEKMKDFKKPLPVSS